MDSRWEPTHQIARLKSASPTDGGRRLHAEASIPRVYGVRKVSKGKRRSSSIVFLHPSISNAAVTSTVVFGTEMNISVNSVLSVRSNESLPIPRQEIGAAAFATDLTVTG